jgi:nucleoside-triphosphatase
MPRNYLVTGPPRVGKTTVLQRTIDRLADLDVGGVCSPERRENGDRVGFDLVAIDEIGPMQVHSDAFVRETRRTLEADLPVLAAIKAQPAGGFVDEVYDRVDVELFEVTVENREELPAVLVDRLPVRGE